MLTRPLHTQCNKTCHTCIAVSKLRWRTCMITTDTHSLVTITCTCCLRRKKTARISTIYRPIRGTTSCHSTVSLERTLYHPICFSHSRIPYLFFWSNEVVYVHCTCSDIPGYLKYPSCIFYILFVLVRIALYRNHSIGYCHLFSTKSPVRSFESFVSFPFLL